LEPRRDLDVAPRDARASRRSRAVAQLEPGGATDGDELVERRAVDVDDEPRGQSEPPAVRPRARGLRRLRELDERHDGAALPLAPTERIAPPNELRDRH